MTDDATYTFAGVAKILEISESRLRYWSQVGFVGPSVRRGGKQVFNFQDLVSVKAAKELVERGFKAGEVRKALDAVRASLPHIPRPLDRIRVSFDGKALVVVDEGGAYDVTGQRVFDFGLGDLARRITDVGQGGVGDAGVTPLPGAADDAAGLPTSDGGRNAYDWFMEGTRLEGRPISTRPTIKRRSAFGARWRWIPGWPRRTRIWVSSPTAAANVRARERASRRR